MLLLDRSKTLEYVTTLKQFTKSIQEIKEYTRVVEKPIVSLDLETFSTLGVFPRAVQRTNGDWEGHISLLQIGLDPARLDKQYIFDLKTLPDVAEEFKFLEWVTVLGQNLKYDWAFMYYQLGIELHKLRDVMLVSQVLEAGDKLTGNLEKSSNKLHNLYKKYLSQTFFKAETGRSFLEYEVWKERMQKSDWSGTPTQEQLNYACDDVRLIHFLYAAQKEQVKEFSKKYNCPGINKVIQLECSLIPVFSQMEIRGFKFDVDNHTNHVIPYLENLLEKEKTEVAKYFTREVEKYETKPMVTKNGKIINKKIKKWKVRECINLGSWQQKAAALEPFIPDLPKSDKGNTSTGADVLIYYTDRHPAVQHMLNYSRYAKALNTYGMSLVEKTCEDGRIRASWHQIGRDDDTIGTGRTSCSDPNLMNQPHRGFLGEYQAGKLMRASYTADEGFELIIADVSNGEVRIMAQHTNDPVLVDSLKNDKDMHAITAKDILDLDEIPDKNGTEEEKENRDIGKQTYLSLQYMMGIKKYQKDMYVQTEGKINWSYDDAKMRREKFFELYKGLKEAQERLTNKIQRLFEPHDSLDHWKGRKVVFVETTPMGRPRRWCLTQGQEYLALDPLKKHVLGKNHEIRQENGRWGTFGNEWSNRLHGIIREAFNFPIQGTLADIIKLAMLEIHTSFRQAGLDPKKEIVIAQIHDEVIVEVKKENVELAKKLVHGAMMKSAQRFIKRVPVKVDISNGLNWTAK